MTDDRDDIVRTIRLSDIQHTDVFLRRRSDAGGGHDIGISRPAYMKGGPDREQVEAWDPNVAEKIGTALIELAREARRDKLSPPEGDSYWLAERDGLGCIRLNSGRGQLVANLGTSREEIQGWHDRATHRQWRETYKAALNLLDREEEL